MSLLTNSSVRLAGIAACVPEHIEYNSAFELLNTQERDLLIKTTGIRERRVAKSGTCTSDLCYQAAIELLDELNWSRDEVDLLLFVTQTPDYITPATSAVLQDRLGLKTGLIAFDINLGCSGYVYGLSVAASMMQSGQIKKALLLVGDISTACISDKDKSTAPIFSDAGTATALCFDPDAEDMQMPAPQRHSALIPMLKICTSC